MLVLHFVQYYLPLCIQWHPTHPACIHAIACAEILTAKQRYVVVFISYTLILPNIVFGNADTDVVTVKPTNTNAPNSRTTKIAQFFIDGSGLLCTYKHWWLSLLHVIKALLFSTDTTVRILSCIKLKDNYNSDPRLYNFTFKSII